MYTALRLTILDKLRQGTSRRKRPRNLLIEFLAVRYDDEGPIAPKSAQHLLGKHHHRQALTAALCVPEDAETPPVLPNLVHCLNGTVHAEHLVIRCNNLAQATTRVFEQ